MGKLALIKEVVQLLSMHFENALKAPLAGTWSSKKVMVIK